MKTLSRNKIFVSSVLSLFLSACGSDDPQPTSLETALSNVTDNNLKSCISKYANSTNTDRSEKVTDLACTNAGIASLTGIGSFTNLTTLSLDNNQISDISPLSSLTKLTKLNLANNDIDSDLTTLTKASVLKELNISNNSALTCTSISTLETSMPNTSITKDKRCYAIEFNAITDLNLKACVSASASYYEDAVRLSCPNKDIEELTGLSKLSGFLTTLALNDNNISDTSSLLSLDFLSELDLTNNPIECDDFSSLITALPNVNITGESSCKVSEAAAVTELSLPSFTVFLPDGLETPAIEDQPQGDFNGSVFYAGEENVSALKLPKTKQFAKQQQRETIKRRELAGFNAERPAFNDGNDAATVLSRLSQSIYSDDLSNRLSTISTRSRTVNNDSVASASYNLVADDTLDITDLNNQLIQLFGLNKESGQLTSEPTALTQDTQYKEFRLNISVRYKDANTLLVSTVVTPEEEANKYQTIRESLTDGSNVGYKNTKRIDQQDDFTGKSGSGIADFLFVIDNSGSMADEQNALSQVAQDFSNVIANAGLDFQVGTITTDSETLRGKGFTNDLSQIQQDIVAGIYGSTTETGIYYAEQSLSSINLGDTRDGSSTAAGHPRTNASMSVIILSDEESQYYWRAGKEFDLDNNLFVARNYRVYSIIEEGYNNDSQYDDLANATGGLVSSISDTRVFPQIAQQIATDAGGATSSFVLSQSGISATLRITVNDVEVAKDSTNGWQYNITSNSVFFTGQAIPKEGDKIAVFYQYISN